MTKMSLKDEIKETPLFRSVKIITLIIPCVLVVMLFFPFITYLYVVPVNYALGGQFIGFQAFLLGGYVAIVLLVISTSKLFKQELPNTLTLISTILVGINVASIIGVYIFIDMDPNVSYLYVDSGFYLLIVILVLSIIDTIFTSKLKKQDQLK